MGIFRKWVLVFCAAGYAAGAEPAPAAPPPGAASLVPQLLHSVSYLLDEDTQGDTLLLRAARGAYNMPGAARAQLFDPFITQLLHLGHDPLHENKAGCNTVFYLAGIPDLYRQLQEQELLPRELALRIPHEEGALLRYMKLRNNQALLAKAPGSREYLTRRYCAPALIRTERLVRSYLGATTLSRIPADALADCLAFMHLANPEFANRFVNSLTVWEHGEHFLEEIPAHLLATLRSMDWQVDPELLRSALHKLGTMLPVSKDDMIECAASAPMSRILEMLTRQEGERALPELQQYAAAFDPEIVHTSLALQMKLKGLPLPTEPRFAEFTTPELVEIREAILVDAAIRYGRMEQLSARQLTTAAGILRKHNMPHHAEMMEVIVEGDTISLRPELRPAFRTRYEELRETAPHVSLLLYLMEHQELLQASREVQP
mgnify:CR=1 FL=1